MVDECLETVRQSAHVLVDLRCLGPKLTGVVLEELWVGENRFELFVAFLIEVAVDVCAEVLDLSDDVPVLVLVESLVDKVHHPTEQRVFVAVDVFDDFVDGLLLHLTVVEAYVDVGFQSQFACEVSEDTLEEAVDGLHAEIVISVEDTVEGECCPLLYVVVGELRHAVVELLDIVVATGQAVCQGEELAEDTGLHLFGGLVGEGHSEGIAEVLWFRHQQFDVFQCQSVSLAAASTGFEYGQPRVVFHISVFC